MVNEIEPKTRFLYGTSAILSALFTVFVPTMLQSIGQPEWILNFTWIGIHVLCIIPPAFLTWYTFMVTFYGRKPK